MIKFAKAIGANTDLLTAQAFVYQSCLAVLISGSGDDVFIKVRQTNPFIEEKFFSSQDGPAIKIPQLIETLQKELIGVLDLQILVSFWQGEILYLYSTGQHKAFLKRDEKISELILPGRNGQLVSGFLKEKDKLLLLGIGVQEGLGDEIVGNFLNQPLDSFEEELEIFLLQSKISSPIATVLIENQSEKVSLEGEFAASNPTQKTNRVFNKLETVVARVRLILGMVFRKKEEESFGNQVRHSKKMRFFLIIFLILAVVMIAGWSFLSKKTSEKNNRFIKYYSAAKDRYTQAQNRKDSDPVGAIKDLDDAKLSLSEAQKIKPKDPQLLSLKQEVEEGSKSILKITEIPDWPLFLSLDLIKKDFSASKMSFSQGKLLLLDVNKKTLVVVDLAKKSNQILAGNIQLGDAKYASLNGALAFVYSEDKGVIRVDISSLQAAQVIKPDSDWGKISDIFGFSNNIYLLDSVKNQVWKYLPAALDYSDKNKYLKGEPGLSGADRLKIDYSVWILKNGQILKFTAGAGDFFSIGGLDKPLGGVDSFFVPEDLDNVYILDKVNTRIVIVKKNGQYLAQIKGEKLKNTDDFVVDSDGKKLYLLEGNNIYQVEVK